MIVVFQNLDLGQQPMRWQVSCVPFDNVLISEGPLIDAGSK